MNKELLKKICLVGSPSGSETDIRDFITAEIKDVADEITTDALGNLIARKKGVGPKMMLAGHMDQIGFMVTFIDENGFLRFSNLGGFNEYNLYSQRVRFKNGTIGVICCERLDNLRTEFKMDKLFIDIGARNQEEAEKQVQVGDVCVYCSDAVVDDYKLMAPAVDDRVGCFVMIEMMKQLKNPVFDTYFVFTVQEEVGLRGAKAAAYAIDPDYGIAFDVTTSHDTPNARKFSMKMGNGAAIKIKDASIISHPKIVSHMENMAKKYDIPYQFEILESGGTDSGAIHLTKSGVPSGCISISTRHIHSDSEICSLKDIESAIELGVHVLENQIS